MQSGAKEDVEVEALHIGLCTVLEIHGTRLGSPTGGGNSLNIHATIPILGCGTKICIPWSGHYRLLPSRIKKSCNVIKNHNLIFRFQPFSSTDEMMLSTRTSWDFPIACVILLFHMGTCSARSVYDYQTYGGPNVLRRDYPDIDNEFSATPPPVIAIKFALGGYLMSQGPDQNVKSDSTFRGDEMLWEVYSNDEAQDYYYFKNVQNGCYLSRKAEGNRIACERCDDQTPSNLPCPSIQERMEWSLHGGYSTGFDQSNWVTKVQMIVQNGQYNNECIRFNGVYHHATDHITGYPCGYREQIIQIEAFGTRP